MAKFLYKNLVDWFHAQLSQGQLVPGDKMPSLRQVAKEQGLSLNTVIHGYDILSQEGWIESRPKSGYFVCHRSSIRPAILLAGERFVEESSVSAISRTEEHRQKYLHAMMGQLYRLSDQEKPAGLPTNGMMSHVQGEADVRQELSAYLSENGMPVSANRIWLVHSPQAVLCQMITTLTEQGDTVLLVTPSDFRLRQTLQDLERRVITLKAGERGVDMDVLDSCLKEQEVKLVLLPGQFAFPAGQKVSNLTWRRWLSILQETSTPAIEWDLHSGLGYRDDGVMNLSALDESGLVSYIGGIENVDTGLPVFSWCLPGTGCSKLLSRLRAANLSPTLDHQKFFQRTMMPHWRKRLGTLSRKLWINSEKVKAMLEEKLPGAFSVASVKGGTSLWLRSDKALGKSFWDAYLSSSQQGLVPGNWLLDDDEASHWLAVNLASTQLVSLVDWLALQLSESKNEKAEKQEATVKRDTDEPIYNPMLDLIQHDFG